MNEELTPELKPVELEACEDQCEDCDCEPAEIEWLAEPVAVPRPEPVKTKPAATNKRAETYTAQDGDTFASIAAAFKPPGMSKHAYSVHLSLLNGGTLRPGTEVKL